MGCKNQPSGPLPPCSSGPAGGRATAVVANSRALLSDAQFNDVLYTVLDNNPGMAPDLAMRILGEALAFLATAATTSVSLVPSRVVDEGWHALILHTGLYYDLCGRLGGFLHHVPERPDVTRYDPAVLTRTTDAMKAAGHRVDHDLWRGPGDSSVPVAAGCQHSDDGGTIIITPKPKG